MQTILYAIQETRVIYIILYFDEKLVLYTLIARGRGVEHVVQRSVSTCDPNLTLQRPWDVGRSEIGVNMVSDGGWVGPCLEFLFPATFCQHRRLEF